MEGKLKGKREKWRGMREGREREREMREKRERSLEIRELSYFYNFWLKRKCP